MTLNQEYKGSCRQANELIDAARDQTSDPFGMTDALTDLDRAVVEGLGACYARDGEAAFDEAASHLVVTVCGVLAHAHGMTRMP
jgi:hypothetical protein